MWYGPLEVTIVISKNLFAPRDQFPPHWRQNCPCWEGMLSGALSSSPVLTDYSTFANHSHFLRVNFLICKMKRLTSMPLKTSAALESWLLCGPHGPPVADSSCPPCLLAHPSFQAEEEGSTLCCDCQCVCHSPSKTTQAPLRPSPRAFDIVTGRKWALGWLCRMGCTVYVQVEVDEIANVRPFWHQNIG